MFGRLICLVPLMALALVRPTSAADYGEQQACFAVEVDRSLGCLVNVCKVAWTFDNLRPVLGRANWPEATLFKPAEAPVIHLSPGSPRYRAIVGEIAYWDARSCYGKKCLLDTGHLSAKDDVKLEILRVGGQLVEAKANYRRACTWAWPYSNLRPLAKQPGLEPATILNPFLPVPTVNLSSSSPTYKEIVAQLVCWDAEVSRCEKSLKDICEKNNIPLPNAGAQKHARGEKRNVPLRTENYPKP